jgi:hypothetical protein
MSGLRNQIIGGEGSSSTTPSIDDGSHFNVYHLLIPYYIGDSRINISPVFIYNVLQTSLSLSKTAVKFGDYFYPTTASNDRLFLLYGNKIVQSDKIIIRDDFIKIGNNTYVFDLGVSNGSYFFQKDSDSFKLNNFGTNINTILSTTALSDWEGITFSPQNRPTSIQLSNHIRYKDNDYGINTVSYITLSTSNGANILVVNDNYMYRNYNFYVGDGGKVSIPVISNSQNQFTVTAINGTDNTTKINLVSLTINNSN